MANHIKSENHANSLETLSIKEFADNAVERSMQEERTIKEYMNFTILSSTLKTQPKATVTVHTPQRSEEEQVMWHFYELSNKTFDAGIDHILAAANEKQQLEQEASNFDLWHSVDFLPEEDPNDVDLFLCTLLSPT